MLFLSCLGFLYPATYRDCSLQFSKSVGQLVRRERINTHMSHHEQTPYILFYMQWCVEMNAILSPSYVWQLYSYLISSRNNNLWKLKRKKKAVNDMIWSHIIWKVSSETDFFLFLRYQTFVLRYSSQDWNTYW